MLPCHSVLSAFHPLLSSADAVCLTRSVLRRGALPREALALGREGAPQSMWVFEDTAHSGISAAAVCTLAALSRDNAEPTLPSKVHSLPVPKAVGADGDDLLAELLWDMDGVAHTTEHRPSVSVAPVATLRDARQAQQAQVAPERGASRSSILDAVTPAWLAVHWAGTCPPSCTPLLILVCVNEVEGAHMHTRVQVACTALGKPGVVIESEDVLHWAAAVQRHAQASLGTSASGGTLGDVAGFPDISQHENGSKQAEDDGRDGMALWGLDGASGFSTRNRTAQQHLTGATALPSLPLLLRSRPPPGVCCMSMSQYVHLVAPALTLSAAIQAMRRQAQSVFKRVVQEEALGASMVQAAVQGRVLSHQALFVSLQALLAHRAARLTPVHQGEQAPGSALPLPTSLFPPHLPHETLSTLVRQGWWQPDQGSTRYSYAAFSLSGVLRQGDKAGLPVRKGCLRMARGSRRLGIVRLSDRNTPLAGGEFSIDSSRASGGAVLQMQEVVLLGPWALNRAIEGDEVAVLLMPTTPAPTVHPVHAKSVIGPALSLSDALTEDGRGIGVNLAGLAGREQGDGEEGEEALTSDGAGGPWTGHQSVGRPLQPGQCYGVVIGIVRRRLKPIVATIMSAGMLSRWREGGVGGGGPDAVKVARPVTEAGHEDGAGAGNKERDFMNDGQLFAVPIDERIPKIRVRAQHSMVVETSTFSGGGGPGAAADEGSPSSLQNILGHRVTVVIDEWMSDSAYPSGHHTGIIGLAGTLETEVRTVILEAGVGDHTRPFPPAAVACLPPIPPSGRWSFAWYRASALAQSGWLAKTVTDNGGDVQATRSALHALLSAPYLDCPGDTSTANAALHRLLTDIRDLRWDCPVASVDPPGCTDIDDALSMRPSPIRPDCIEVGVHIADVTRFMRHGDALDGEARTRGTTVYLADRRLDMLPAALSENVCSLRARVDRCALSVLWTLRPIGGAAGDARAVLAAAESGMDVSRHGNGPIPECDWEIVPGGVWMGRTLIRSSHALTYDQAAACIVGRQPGSKMTSTMDTHGKLAVDRDDSGADMRAVTDSIPRGPLPRAAAGDAREGAHTPFVLCAADFDPKAGTKQAMRMRAEEKRKYSTDPTQGGLCGAAVHDEDIPALAVRLRVLSSVAHWLHRKRGRQGDLELNSGEIRFALDGKGKNRGNGRERAIIGGGSGAPSESGAASGPALPRAEEGEAAILPYDEKGEGEEDMERGVPSIKISVKHSEDIHETIAELMIFANEAAAALCFASFPDAALLRRHAPADNSRFTDLLAAAESAGIQIDVSSKASLAMSLDKAISTLHHARTSTQDGGAQSALLRALTLRAMTRAEYFSTSELRDGAGAASTILLPQPPSTCAFPSNHTPASASMRARGVHVLERTQGGAVLHGLHDIAEMHTAPEPFAHYGLGIGLYTHFTSPIRRYADDIVHRTIAAALGLEVFRAVGKTVEYDPSSGTDGGSRRKQEVAKLPPSTVRSALDAVSSRLSLGDGRALPTLNLSLAIVDGEEEKDLLTSLLGEDSVETDKMRATLPHPSPPAPAPASTCRALAHPPFPSTLLRPLAEHLNERNQAAKVAGWEANDLFLSLYLRHRCVLTEAVVSGIEILPMDTAAGAGKRPQSGWLRDTPGGPILCPTAILKVHIPRYNLAGEIPVLYDMVPHSSTNEAGNDVGQVACLPPAFAPAFSAQQLHAHAKAHTNAPLPPYAMRVLSKAGAGRLSSMCIEGAAPVCLYHVTGSWNDGSRDANTEDGSGGGKVRPAVTKLTALLLHSPATATTTTIRVLDPLLVALSCTWVLGSPRRPPITMCWIGDTPSVRAMMQQQDEQENGPKGSSTNGSKREDAAARTNKQPGTVTAINAPVHLTVAPVHDSIDEVVDPLLITLEHFGRGHACTHAPYDGAISEERRRVLVGEGTVGQQVNASIPIQTSELAAKMCNSAGAGVGNAKAKLTSKSSPPSHLRPVRVGPHEVLGPGRWRTAGYQPPYMQHMEEAWARQLSGADKEETVAEYTRFSAVAQGRNANSSTLPFGDRGRAEGADKGGPETGAAALMSYIRSLAIADGEVLDRASAYAGRAGYALTASELVDNAGALASAEAAARARMMQLQAEKRHTRIDKARKEQRKRQ